TTTSSRTKASMARRKPASCAWKARSTSCATATWSTSASTYDDPLRGGGRQGRAADGGAARPALRAGSRVHAERGEAGGGAQADFLHAVLRQAVRRQGRLESGRHGEPSVYGEHRGRRQGGALRGPRGAARLPQAGHRREAARIRDRPGARRG